MSKEYLLAGILFIIGISAVIGGYILITSHGMGMPTSWLDGSPFSNYLIPGFLLLMIVGGTHILASVFLFMKKMFRFELAVIAGFSMMIFEFFELYITKQNHFLQIFYFFAGMFVVGSSYLLKSSSKQ